MGRRTLTEAATDLYHDYTKPLVISGLATAALIGLWTNTEDKIVEPTAKRMAELGVDFVDLVTPGDLNITLPWENDHNLRESPQQAGQLVLNTYLGTFANYAEARTSLKTEILGKQASESHTLSSGVIVSRLELPGVPVLDWKADDDVMYMTRYVDGKDSGIPLDKVSFTMQQPVTATMHDGEYGCTLDIHDVGYSGCVEADSVRVSFWAGLPGFEDNDGNLQIAGEMVLDEFAKIEKCHFDNIFIPAFNKIYEENGIDKRLDGPGAYSEVMRTFIRYFLREPIADNTPPQRVFVKFDNSSYTPTAPIRSRMEDLGKEVDFPFELGEDIESNYCATTSDGLIPIAVPGETDLNQVFMRIAIGGMEVVPEGFNIRTGQFEQGAYAGAELDTGLGDIVKGILGD